MDNVGQYRVVTYKNDERIGDQVIDDPFVHTTIVDSLSRWDAFKAFLRGGFENRFVVNVSGEPAAHRVVFTGDYTPPPPTEPHAMEGAYYAEAVEK